MHRLLVAIFVGFLASCGPGTEHRQHSTTASTATTASPQSTTSGPTTTSTTTLAQFSDEALLTSARYTAEQAVAIAAKRPARSSFRTSQSTTIVLSFGKGLTFNPEAGVGVTQYVESIKDVRLTLDPLGTGPAEFLVRSDPRITRHIVLLLTDAEPVPSWAEKRPIARQPVGGTTYLPTESLAVSLIRARTIKQANDIFTVETGQRTLDVILTGESRRSEKELRDAGREQIINSLGVAISAAGLGTAYPAGGRLSFPGWITLTYLPLHEFPADFPRTPMFG